ncbi:hypothetical protein DCAR_0729267 [Daucus carota subsp. sativus]|uniref:Uncharacterized protein n=1 Tax=Daucus carota subsp. sativus TaxID=79200 RepID=A0A164U395_DAUCS|nr:PREDICTED: 36.4 kDa proline-rich protein-like [Daucus carota subsp. sativus]WOH09808.1 hypothetical protein DCAR_0729267 [Daucus carota subsp. sativus]
MSWLLALVLFCLALHSNAKAITKTQLRSATVVGTVYCHTCLQNDFSALNHFISGALVAVECDGTKPSSRFRKEVKTNKHGQFKVNLPFPVTKHVKNIKKCSVNLVRSNNANCAVASTATTSSFHLKSIKARTHIFSAGFLTFKPLTQPNICNQKPKINRNSKDSVDNDPSTFPPPLRDPPDSSIIPPIDNPGQFTPLPILPRLPPLPELPNLPPILPPKQATLSKTSSDLINEKPFFLFPPIFPNPFAPPLVPNPLQPPPAIVPPVIPSPPPSVLPPVLPTPPQPPPSIFPPVIPSPPTGFPPVPGLSPPVVPPPPPPIIPILPPGFPGVPPARTSTSSHSKESKHP